ncbi:MAG: HD domain-containing protein, partial [Planctomycetota bacterium]
PAARTNHHAYLGGLLEHTLNLLELALLVLPRYPDVSPDLVLVGIFLHDAGKTAELTCGASFDYTDEGQLVGHIVQAAIWVHERASQAAAKLGRPFDPHVLMALKHIIIAHHGRYEFGSPKLPATAEAFMVHYLDNLDAKLNMVFGAIDDDVDEGSDWTKWVPALESRVYKPDVTRRS